MFFLFCVSAVFSESGDIKQNIPVASMSPKWEPLFPSALWVKNIPIKQEVLIHTVKTKETETWINGAKKEVRENINATWKIQYSITDDTLTLTGSDLPKELANLQLSRTGRWH